MESFVGFEVECSDGVWVEVEDYWDFRFAKRLDWVSVTDLDSSWSWIDEEPCDRCGHWSEWQFYTVLLRRGEEELVVYCSDNEISCFGGDFRVYRGFEPDMPKEDRLALVKLGAPITP